MSISKPPRLVMVVNELYCMRVITLAATTLLLGCTDARQDRLDSVGQLEAEAQTSIRELAELHGANPDWSADLPDPYLERLFTVDLQERLVDDGDPIVFRGDLVDVVRADTGVIAFFEPSYDAPPIYFRLLVPAADAEQLIASPRQHYSIEFVVAAVITGIRRPAFVLSSTLTARDEFASPDLEVETGNLYVADGRLIAFRLIDW
jgi:hypothetical protein